MTIMIIYASGVGQHFALLSQKTRKKDSRKVEKHVEKLFNEYYEGKEDIKQHSGVKYIEYNKYYDEENEESLIDEVSKLKSF